MLAMSVVDGVSSRGQVKPDFIIINTEKKMTGIAYVLGM
jgi:hypothetical protein